MRSLHSWLIFEKLCSLEKSHCLPQGLKKKQQRFFKSFKTELGDTCSVQNQFQDNIYFSLSEIPCTILYF